MKTKYICLHVMEEEEHMAEFGMMIMDYLGYKRAEVEIG